MLSYPPLRGGPAPESTRPPAPLSCPVVGSPAWRVRLVRGLPRMQNAVAVRFNFLRYSHDYPVSEGHDYSLNAIPVQIWARAKQRAHAEQRSVRGILIRALDLYGSGKIDF